MDVLVLPYWPFNNQALHQTLSAIALPRFSSLLIINTSSFRSHDFALHDSLSWLNCSGLPLFFLVQRNSLICYKTGLRITVWCLGLWFSYSELQPKCSKIIISFISFQRSENVGANSYVSGVGSKGVRKEDQGIIFFKRSIYKVTKEGDKLFIIHSKESKKKQAEVAAREVFRKTRKHFWVSKNSCREIMFCSFPKCP